MLNGEPSLEEMLVEPIVQLLMAADGLNPEDVASMVQGCRALRSRPESSANSRRRSEGGRGQLAGLEKNQGRRLDPAGRSRSGD